MKNRLGELIDEHIGFQLDPDSCSYEAQVSPEDIYHFGMNLIHECMNVCLTNADEHSERNRGIWHDPTEQVVSRKLANKMKEHFGVEE